MNRIDQNIKELNQIISDNKDVNLLAINEKMEHGKGKLDLITAE